MKVKKYIGIGLIVIGISIIAVAMGMKYWAFKKQQDMINAFQKTLQQVDSKDSSYEEKSSNKKPPTLDQGAIGIMTIPKINLNVAIGEGVDLETLKYAVGHFPGTGQPGQAGNFCVAGHRSYTYSEYFNRLNEVTNGDEIIIKTKKGEYKYKVYNSFVVEPSEVSVLNPTKDATLTLVTCTPIRIASHRLIIKARLE
ncbi:MAG: sortase family protein LPXTG-site transpeptidase [Clostridiaceae bacterium]|nr:sortase family protein LPXTG-site transpeptidase [Clostridiaceae bacterium]